MFLNVALITSIILLATKTLAEASQSQFAQRLSKAITIPIVITIVILLFGVSIRIGKIIPELLPYFSS